MIYYFSFLSHKVDTFYADSIAKHYDQWLLLTSDQEILSTVSGLPLEFQTTLVSTYTFKQGNMNQSESEIVKTELAAMIKKKVIEKSCNESHTPGHINMDADKTSRQNVTRTE